MEKGKEEGYKASYIDSLLKGVGLLDIVVGGLYMANKDFSGIVIAAFGIFVYSLGNYIENKRYEKLIENYEKGE